MAVSLRVRGFLDGGVERAVQDGSPWVASDLSFRAGRRL